MMTVEEAIQYLRTKPEYAELLLNSYLDEDLEQAAERFRTSAEMSEVKKLIGPCIRHGTLLDLGAGNGIASYAFAKCSARLVYALEPSPSDEVGRGAISRLTNGMPVEVVDAFGEDIPLNDEQIDLVYARQVLHHCLDLRGVLHECARVLKRGGRFLACREHVVDNEHDLRVFLDNHPVHQLAGGENAFPLETYTSAIEAAGLKILRILGPWDTIINAFPMVETPAQLERLPRTLLERRFGRSVGALASAIPGAEAFIWAWRKRRREPGRLFSFLAAKQ